MEEDRRSWRRAYRLLGYSTREYLLRLILPFATLGIITLVISFLLADLLGPMRFVMYILAGFFPLVGIFYPKIWADTRRREIEQNIHLFITHAGILATAEMDRIEIFRSLAKRREAYGPLAEEIGKVVTLVDTWNQSLEEACRYVSNSTPSDILSDFLDRLARVSTAGEDVREFLLDEQDVVISDYQSSYEDALDRITNFRDLFLSMVLATVFFVVFSLVAPFISGISPLLMMGIAIGIFVISEIGFILATKFTMPEDPIWCEMDINTDRDARMGRIQVLSLALFVGLAAFSAAHLFFNLFSGLSLPPSLYLTLAISPLAIPGLMIWGAERRLKERDRNYPGFIRTLSASASARRTQAVDVLKSLKEKDFGALSSNIKGLYKRLRMRAEEALAWDHFSAEAGSHLIRRFNDMYSEGTAEGGDPKTMGDIVTENFKKIGRIREKRYGFADSLTGVLYGVTAAAPAAFFIGFYFMKEVIGEVVSIAQPSQITGVFSAEIYYLPGLHFMLIGMVLLNALIISIYIRAVSGGHETSSYAHMVFLAWVGMIVAFLVQEMAEAFLAI